MRQRLGLAVAPRWTISSRPTLGVKNICLNGETFVPFSNWTVQLLLSHPFSISSVKLWVSSVNFSLIWGQIFFAWQLVKSTEVSTLWATKSLDDAKHEFTADFGLRNEIKKKTRNFHPSWKILNPCLIGFFHGVVQRAEVAPDFHEKVAAVNWSGLLESTLKLDKHLIWAL